MKLLKKILLGVAGVALTAPAALAFAQTDFFQPYDANLRLARVPVTKVRVGANLEYGSTSKGRNWDGKRKNVLQLRDDHEDVVAVGDSLTSHYINTFIAAWPGIINPAINFGQIKFDGKFKQFDATVFGEYKLPWEFIEGNTKISLSLPIRHASISDVTFTDLTDTSLLSGGIDTNFHTAKYATEALLKTFMALETFEGQTINKLNLDNWSKTGLGDAVLMLYWDRKFKEDKKWLKSVDVHFRAGVSMPTGSKKDVDQAFSIALGNDGAWGIPFGLGLDLNYAYKLRLGADVEFLAFLDESNTYRMKVSTSQTEHLLPRKGRATKDHGLTWKFNLYGQGVNLWQGFSLKAGYEYTKHDSDTLTPKTNDFSTSVVNTARSLMEWNLHSLIFQLNWDAVKVNGKIPTKPQLSFFYKLPVGGKNIIDAQTFGGQLALNF